MKMIHCVCLWKIAISLKCEWNQQCKKNTSFINRYAEQDTHNTELTRSSKSVTKLSIFCQIIQKSTMHYLLVGISHCSQPAMGHIMYKLGCSDLRLSSHKLPAFDPFKIAPKQVGKNWEVLWDDFSGLSRLLVILFWGGEFLTLLLTSED